MKQAHDEILEKWLDEQIIRWREQFRRVEDAYAQGCLDAFQDVKDRLVELWREK